MPDDDGLSPVVRVSIELVKSGDSPRLEGEVFEHARLLAESETPLPPIIVHRRTMRVIDGMHRLRAAKLRGQETIEVKFFEGDDAEAFVAAVQANVTHGLPLTLPDRDAAAGRLIKEFPDHSDRWIASITGLAAKTVAAIRGRAPGAGAPTARIGRDGRVRPLNSAQARRVASEVIAEHPDASLREVARISGLSPATVRDVRERMRRGDDPVPLRERDRQGADGEQRDRSLVRRPKARDRETLLRILNRDPALRFNDSGRTFLRWLAARAGQPLGWERVVALIPPHCGYIVAELAYVCAEEWLTLAGELEDRLSDSA